MSVFKHRPRVFQCDGGGPEDTSDEEASLDDEEEEEEEDEEEETTENESEEEDDEESESIQERQRRSTRQSNPSLRPESGGSRGGRGSKRRMTRQQTREQMPTKRLLRSRKKSPAAGAGRLSSSSTPPVIMCGKCKRKFNTKQALSLHTHWCQNQPKSQEKAGKKEDVKSERKSGPGRKSNAKKEPPPTHNPDGTPIVKRGRGRPPRNPQNQNANLSKATPTSSKNRSHSLPEQNRFHETPQEMDFLQGRSPSSPGLADTSSESEYEQREFAANAHQLIQNRSHSLSIDVVNPDPEDQDGEGEDHQNAYQEEILIPPPPQQLVQQKQEELVIPQEGPVTCPQCKNTYRTVQGYQNHWGSCMAYSSDTEDEDEEVDVIDEQRGGNNWGSSSTSIAQQSLSVPQNNLTQPENEENNSGSESTSSEERSELPYRGVQPVQPVLDPQIDESATQNQNMTSGETAYPPQNASHVIQVHPNSTVMTLQKQDIPRLPNQYLSSANAQITQIPPPQPLATPQQRHNDRKVGGNENANSHVHPTTLIHPQVQVPNLLPPTFSQNHPPSQGQIPAPPQQVHQFPLVHPVQNVGGAPIYTRNASGSVGSYSTTTPILQPSNNTPTYTQAQLMPDTVVHSSVMQVPHQMATTTESSYNTSSTSSTQPQPTVATLPATPQFPTIVYDPITQQHVLRFPPTPPAVQPQQFQNMNQPQQFQPQIPQQVFRQAAVDQRLHPQLQSQQATQSQQAQHLPQQMSQPHTALSQQHIFPPGMPIQNQFNQLGHHQQHQQLPFPNQNSTAGSTAPQGPQYPPTIHQYPHLQQPVQSQPAPYSIPPQHNSVNQQHPLQVSGQPPQNSQQLQMPQLDPNSVQTQQQQQQPPPVPFHQVPGQTGPNFQYHCPPPSHQPQKMHEQNQNLQHHSTQPHGPMPPMFNPSQSVSNFTPYIPPNSSNINQPQIVPYQIQPQQQPPNSNPTQSQPQLRPTLHPQSYFQNTPIIHPQQHTGNFTADGSVPPVHNNQHVPSSEMEIGNQIPPGHSYPPLPPNSYQPQPQSVQEQIQNYQRQQSQQQQQFYNAQQPSTSNPLSSIQPPSQIAPTQEPLKVPQSQAPPQQQQVQGQSSNVPVNPLLMNPAFQWNKVNPSPVPVQPNQLPNQPTQQQQATTSGQQPPEPGQISQTPQQQPQQNPASQPVTQVIQQIAQYTDASGNTNTVIIVTPAAPQGTAVNSSALAPGVLNLLPGLQAIAPQPQIQAQTQSQSPNTICALSSTSNGAQSSCSQGNQAQGRSGPCPCPTCKEKTSNSMEKYKKVLPYPGSLTSPNSELQRISPRPIQIRPAGTKPPQKTIRLQKGGVLLQPQTLQQPQVPGVGSPLKVLPLAVKTISPAPSINGQPITTSIGGIGVVLENNAVNRSNIPLPNSNIAVVRPMENPLQKLTDQISQIESSFMAPVQQPQQPQFPLAQQLLQQQHLGNGSPTPAAVAPQTFHVPQGPHLTLVTASPPLRQALTAQTSPPPIIPTATTVLSQASTSPSQSSTQAQQPTKTLEGPRLVLVDHGSPARLSSPSRSSTPVSAPTTPARTQAGVKRKLPPSDTSADPASKSIKVTLRRKEGDDNYSIKGIQGPTKSTGGNGGTMKSLKIKGQIKSGEQAGTSTDVVVVPCIHLVPIPDPDAHEEEGNRTIKEDDSESATEGKKDEKEGESSTPTVQIPESETSVDGSGENNTPIMTHKAVVVYEVKGNELVLFRSGDVRAVWGYIFETVQGTRLNHNLPPLFYPATNISLPQPSRQDVVDGIYNKLGLTHRAVQFLLEQLPGLKALTSSEFKVTKPPPTPSTSSEEEEPVGENESGCARTERFIGRKAFDMFGWLASKHRKKSSLSNAPAESAINLAAPVSMRFRKLKEKADKNLVVWRSPVHGRGLFTRRKIEKGEMVIEYAGEVIRPMVCDLREKYYESKSVGDYMFKIDNDQVIDATMKGNAARFINHSCQPNCEAKVVKISGKDHIIIFALRQIQSGEELTYDYKFETEEEKIPCACGAKHCRKYLN